MARGGLLLGPAFDESAAGACAGACLSMRQRSPAVAASAASAAAAGTCLPSGWLWLPLTSVAAGSGTAGACAGTGGFEPAALGRVMYCSRCCLLARPAPIRPLVAVLAAAAAACSKKPTAWLGAPAAEPAAAWLLRLDEGLRGRTGPAMSSRPAGRKIRCEFSANWIHS